MSYYGAAPTPPRAWELWGAMPARLDTARMQTILGGPGRIYVQGQPTPALGGKDQAWGRIVVVPVRRAYGEPTEQPGRSRIVPFLIRAEVHSPGGLYNPALALEAAHAEAFARLHGWTPGAFRFGAATRPLWRETPPQALPLWDDASGLYYLSAEYRALLSPIPED